MQSVTTDNKEGMEIVSINDGLVAVQVNNNTNSNLYMVTEKTQSFRDRGTVVPPNSQWPINGPQLWAGSLHVYSDVQVTFGIIKSATLSLVPQSKKGAF